LQRHFEYPIIPFRTSWQVDQTSDWKLRSNGKGRRGGVPFVLLAATEATDQEEREQAEELDREGQPELGKGLLSRGIGWKWVTRGPRKRLLTS
jgi:hypothetical protein